MSRPEAIALLAEKFKRRKQQGFTPELLFDVQRDFALDPARMVAACCSRRAGKTEADAWKLAHVARSRDNVNVVYSALTIKSARRNIWPRLVALNKDYALGGKTNESRFTMTFQNGSVIHLTGMDDIGEADKWRGMPRLLLAILDEAQSYRDEVLDYAVREVFRPGMLDLAGSQILLTGSPGPIPTGYFHKIITAEKTPWSRHGWTLFQNQFLEGDPWEEVRDACEEKGCDQNDPWIQRNYFNQWISDVESLIYPYDAARNHYDPGVHVASPGWFAPMSNFHPSSIFTAGCDFGVRDADAIAVWAIRERTAYLAGEFVQRGQTTDKIVEQIKEATTNYNLMDLSGDPAGGGARIALDLAGIHGINLRAADKQDRAAAVNLLADAIRSGRIKAPRDSRLVADWRRLEWEPGLRGLREKKSGFHSDIADAALYGWRAGSKYFTLEESPPGSVRALTRAEQWEKRWEKFDEDLQDQQQQDWAERDKME